MLVSSNAATALSAEHVQAEKAAPLRIKKLYVLAAFEVEKAREDVHMARGASSLTTLGLGAAAGPTYTAAGTRVNATLQGLVTLDAAAVQVRSLSHQTDLPACLTAPPDAQSTLAPCMQASAVVLGRQMRGHGNAWC